MLLTIIWIVVGVVLLGLYNAHLLLDDKTPEDSPLNRKYEDDWHLIGSILFIYLSLTFWYITDSMLYVFFTLSCFWLIYGGIVHKIGLNKPFFYVGTTAKTDKLLRKYFPKNPEKGSMIVKISVLIITLIFIILK